MKSYTHLSLEEREKLYILFTKCSSLRGIGKVLGRNVSTISREIKRNTCINMGYLPDRAQYKAKKRRYGCADKIKTNNELKEYIIKKLTIDKWSPEIIAGRIKHEGRLQTISPETIYKFIYSREGSKLRLYEHLMYRRERRCIHHSRKHRVKIAPQHSIMQRPEIIGNKIEFGHFEGDLTFFKGSNSANFLVLIEKLSRKSFITKNKNKRSIGIMNKIHSILKVLPSHARKSITFDNGNEFRKFGILSLAGIHTYFCRPHSPWEKGQVERLNAQLHKFIKKSSEIKSVTDDLLRDTQNKLNNLPRKSLKFLTPNELWNMHIDNNVALQN